MALRELKSPRPRRTGHALAAALAALLATPLGAGCAGVLKIADGVILAYPATWSQAPSRYANQLELVRIGDAPGAPEARLIATVERRIDHDDALRRLREIAAEHDAPVTVLEIAGWPAIQRRHRQRLPRTGAATPEPPGDGPFHLTTAIAFDATLVRLEGRLLSPTDEILEEIEHLTRRVRLDRKADPERTRRELDALRSELSSPPSSEH